MTVKELKVYCARVLARTPHLKDEINDVLREMEGMDDDDEVAIERVDVESETEQ